MLSAYTDAQIWVLELLLEECCLIRLIKTGRISYEFTCFCEKKKVFIIEETTSFFYILSQPFDIHKKSSYAVNDSRNASKITEVNFHTLDLRSLANEFAAVFSSVEEVVDNRL